MSLSVRLHWAERFLNWFPHHTKLYIRGERGKDTGGRWALQKELFDALAPFFDVLRREAIREGHQNGVRIDARVFDWADRTERHGLPTDVDLQYEKPRRFGVILNISDTAGNPIGTFQTPMQMKLHKADADQMVVSLTAPGARMEKETGS